MLLRAVFVAVLAAVLFGTAHAAAVDGVVWKSTVAEGKRELPDSSTRFRLALGDKLTVIAQVRLPDGLQGNQSIARTPCWEFGVRADGTLYFTLPGKGGRTSTAITPPEVPPLYVSPETSWSPAPPQSGRIPKDTWVPVAWTIDTQGEFWTAFGFYINGLPQGISLGGIFSVPATPGPVLIGGGTAGGFDVREVRLFDRKLSAEEVAFECGGVPVAKTVDQKIPQVLPATRQGSSRLIIAHRMIGFGPSFGGTQDPANRASGAGSFVFPVKQPKGANIAGWCRDTHIGALHPPFADSVAEYKWEIAQAYAAGVDAFVFDTCGGLQDFPIPEKMLQAAEELGGAFKVGLCLDFAAGTMERKAETVKNWLERHGKSPAILRIQGRPAFISYMQYRKPEDVQSFFSTLRQAAGEPIFLHLDLSEVALRGKTAADWEAGVRPYLPLADGIGCFFSRAGLARDTQAFTALAQTAHQEGKLWGMSPWVNYYTPGRSSQVENIGAENSRLWDQMWKLARETRSDYVLLTTWNDITEDTQVMPTVRHFFTYTDLLANYYGPWFRTGEEPKPTHDQVYVFYRPYRTDAEAPLITGPRTRGSSSQDQLEVRAFVTAPSTVVVDGMGRQDIPAGMTSVSFASKPGPVKVSLVRKGKTLLAFQAPEYITTRPWRQDFSIRGFSSEEAAHWKQWFPEGPAIFPSEYGDYDGNGLPNWFEHYYFGRWTGTPPNADPDSDGKTNLQEYQDGTDPSAPPALYPANFVWDAAIDFRPKDETNPIPDALGSKVWEFEFLSSRDRTGQFAPARQLVPQIASWLERGDSWAFAIGSPKEGSLLYTGEADSAAAQVWTSPITGRIALNIVLSHDPTLTWAKAPVTVSLTRIRTNESIYSASFTPPGEPLTVTREITLQRGERLRLAVTGAAGGPRWGARVRWVNTYLGP
ncbi:MAG TPA: endo-1,3-alpha-glucanase family glycosylhydrolase [Armatimonadota bacterium]|jgi:hypothetical protein